MNIEPIQVEGIKITRVNASPTPYRGKLGTVTKTRVFVSIKDETALENFFARVAERAGSPPRLSPRAIRKHVLARVVKELQEKHPNARITSPSQLHWSRHAGCSSCPCSPGYLAENSFNWTIYVEVEAGEATPAS